MADRQMTGLWQARHPALAGELAGALVLAGAGTRAGALGQAGMESRRVEQARHWQGGHWAAGRAARRRKVQG